MEKFIILAMFSVMMIGCAHHHSHHSHGVITPVEKIKEYKSKEAAELHIKEKGWRPHKIKDGSAPIPHPAADPVK